MERIIFKLEDVEYMYPQGIKGIKNVTFQVKQSDTIAVLGPNGSGKSTLLKILDGLYKPCRGRFYAFGEKISANKLKDRNFNRFFRRNVGMLFQDVEAQLFSPTVYHSMPRVRQVYLPCTASYPHRPFRIHREPWSP